MNPKTSNDLFNKIRSQFSNIEIGDETGQPTADSSQAVFFDFEFKEDADTFGRVSVSLADGESMKVFYNRNLVDKIDEDSKDEWFAFLRELKDFAIEHQLRFDVRDITKNNLTKQDYENLADTNKTVNTDEMSEELNRITKLAGVEKAPVAEGLRGTSKSSFENLDKTRLIIRHKGKVDETVPGARSRQIQSLYIENSDGERFKYPLTHLAGARAMQRHVSNGGRPHDDFGQHIIQTSEDIAKLNSFSRYASNKDQLNDNASDMIEKTKMKLENLRTYVKNLSKQSHYDETVKSFKTAEDRVLDDETRNTYREKFTLKTLDDRVEEALPVIHRLMAEYDDEEDQMPKDKDVQPTVLPKDADPIKAEPEAQVDHGAVVQSFLTDPEAKLVLRKDPTADKMLKNTKFKDKSTMLGSILSDIASRMLSKTPEEDRIANFASRVADGIDQEGATSFKPGPDYNSNKKIAVQLAKRYIDDYKKMQSDPAYADAVRMDPAEYSPKKKRSGGVHGEGTEAFESWVDETIKPFTPTVEDEVKEENQLEGLTFEDIKPYVSMYTDKDGKKVNAVLDKDGKEVFKTHDAKAAMAYLSQNYDKLKKEDNAPDMVVRDPEDEAEDKEQEIAKDQEEAEKINTELDRIKHLANI
jgi:Mg2+ and Co2+ transporter CorA